MHVYAWVVSVCHTHMCFPTGKRVHSLQRIFKVVHDPLKELLKELES